jgi:surface polysaccharide O-acyltransferase-like enzyme
MFFLVGYIFMVFDNYRRLVKQYTYLFLLLGVASSWYIFTHYPEINKGETMFISIINAGIRITSSYSWVLFFFGLSQRKLNFNHKHLGSLNSGILPFYILHQTVIILIGFYVISFDLSILLKFLIILSTSLASTIFLYQAIKRVNALRFVFGMKALKKK